MALPFLIAAAAARSARIAARRARAARKAARKKERQRRREQERQERRLAQERRRERERDERLAKRRESRQRRIRLASKKRRKELEEQSRRAGGGSKMVRSRDRSRDKRGDKQSKSNRELARESRRRRTVRSVRSRAKWLSVRARKVGYGGRRLESAGTTGAVPGLKYYPAARHTLVRRAKGYLKAKKERRFEDAEKYKSLIIGQARRHYQGNRTATISGKNQATREILSILEPGAFHGVLRRKRLGPFKRPPKGGHGKHYDLAERLPETVSTRKKVGSGKFQPMFRRGEKEKSKLSKLGDAYADIYSELFHCEVIDDGFYRLRQQVIAFEKEILNRAYRAAVDVCPVDTGRLRDSISKKRDSNDGRSRIAADTEYARYVEEWARFIWQAFRVMDGFITGKRFHQKIVYRCTSPLGYYVVSQIEQPYANDLFYLRYNKVSTYVDLLRYDVTDIGGQGMSGEFFSFLDQLGRNNVRRFGTLGKKRNKLGRDIGTKRSGDYNASGWVSKRRAADPEPRTEARDRGRRRRRR